MSTAAHFAFPDRFPFCVPPISELPTPENDIRLKIVDLDLRDAMFLFWNTESVNFGCQAIGHNSSGGGSTILEVTEQDIPWFTGADVLEPKMRVCNTRPGEDEDIPPLFGIDSIEIEDAYTYPTGTGAAFFDAFYFFREIYLQEDGRYTIIFWYDPSTDAGQFVIGGVPDLTFGNYDYTGLFGEQDLTDAFPQLGSGSIPYYLYSISDDPTFVNDSVTFLLGFTFFSYS